jgi:hypothetical protein
MLNFLRYLPPLYSTILQLLTARVYLNLVWLARKPIVTVDTGEDDFTTGRRVSANIRLQVRRSTTVPADTWRSSGLGPDVYTIPTLDMSGSHILQSLHETDRDEDKNETM